MKSILEHILVIIWTCSYKEGVPLWTDQLQYTNVNFFRADLLLGQDTVFGSLTFDNGHSSSWQGIVKNSREAKTSCFKLVLTDVYRASSEHNKYYVAGQATLELSHSWV